MKKGCKVEVVVKFSVLNTLKMEHFLLLTAIELG